MRNIALLFLFIAQIPGSASSADNLLANPGFETIERNRPTRWSPYTAPMEGAYARVDNQDVHEGTRAIRLHIPHPYDKEPANNWSQNVIGEFGAKDFTLSGWIRVVDATEAALWAQCCTRRPWQVLQFHTSSVDSPISGTALWKRVEMSFTAPEGTEFITIRCVLKGQGDAWFDDMSLVIDEAADVEAPQAPAETAPLRVSPPALSADDMAPLTAAFDEAIEQGALLGKESIAPAPDIPAQLDAIRDEIGKDTAYATADDRALQQEAWRREELLLRIEDLTHEIRALRAALDEAIARRNVTEPAGEPTE